MRIRGYFLFGLLAFLVAMMPLSAAADDFADYKTAAGTTAEVDLPTVTAGWFVATDYFPDGTTEMIDGQFEAEGRLIAANNQTIYLQRTYGSSQWDVVGTISSAVMDPSFIHVSPDGDKIALGIGYNAPLLIIPTNVLSASNPPVLDTHAQVKSFDNVNYYDGDWVDNQYFVINGGSWPSGPGNCEVGVDPGCDGVCEDPYYNDPDCVFESGVGSVDTDAADPANHTGVLVVTAIPGASSDVHVDRDNNLITGLGWAVGPPNRTGELKAWAAAAWDPSTPQALAYDSTGSLVADNILSVAHLGEDAEGNLHIGGGDAFGTGGEFENGYAALIKAGLVDDILTNGSGPVSDGNKSDIPNVYKFFAPDPCQDDSATGILADTWGRGLAVMWNPSGNGSGGCAGSAGSASDYWEVGVTPRLTIYYPGSAPDTDGDGVTDAADNAYLTPNAGQEDADGDGYGNAVDADFDGDGIVGISDFNTFQGAWLSSDPVVDMDSDGSVGISDFNAFQSRWLDGAPYY